MGGVKVVHVRNPRREKCPKVMGDDANCKLDQLQARAWCDNKGMLFGVSKTRQEDHRV